MAAFPLRVVYMKREASEKSDHPEKSECSERSAKSLSPSSSPSISVPPVSVLVSVPKKRFRHAVDRNRMKRLVREAYRQNKHILWEALEGKDCRLALAFVCITDTLPTFRAVEKSMKKVLVRIAERL